MNAQQVAERSAVYALEDAVAPVISEAFELMTTAPQGVAKLRELILSLAVRGKLIAQDLGDVPASTLVEEISVRRKSEPSVSRNRRRLSGSNSTVEEPFEIPSSWVWVGLGDVTYEHGQQTPSVPFTYIDVASVDNELGCIKSELPVVAASDAPSRARKLVKRGTVVYSTVRPYLKNIAIVEEAYDPAPIASTAFAILHPNDGLLSEYLYYYLRSPEFTSFVASRMIGVAYPAINDASFFEGVLPLPPLAEQRRIAARVEELMALCDELEAHGRLQDEQHARLVATLFDALVASTSPAELADNWQRVANHFDLLLDRSEAVDALEQTILQLAVRGLLVPQDPADEPAVTLIRRAAARNGATNGHRKKEGEIGHADSSNVPVLPKGWAWATIDSIASVGTGTTPSRTNPAYFSPPSIPWVTSGETSHSSIARTEQGISPLALRDTSLKLYPIGTLIVAMYGQGKTRGQVSELQIEATTNQACAAIVPATTDVAHRRYLKLFFEKIYDEIRELSAGGAQPNLNVGKVKATLVPLPPLAEQRRIVARVDELRGLCVDLRRHLQQAQATQSHLADALVARAVV